MSIDIVIKVTLCASGPDIDRECLAHTVETAIELYKQDYGLTMEEDTDYIEAFKVEVM